MAGVQVHLLDSVPIRSDTASCENNIILTWFLRVQGLCISRPEFKLLKVSVSSMQAFSVHFPWLPLTQSLWEDNKGNYEVELFLLSLAQMLSTLEPD